MIRNMMQSLISTQNKKDYILWFLNNHNLDDCEGEWLLYYLLKNDDLLNRLEFVRANTPNLNRGLIINSLASRDDAVLFYKGHILTSNIDKAFHDFRMNRNSPIFIEFHYYASSSCPNYLSVLTENIHDDQENDTFIAENLLTYLSYKDQELKLNKAIDFSLDNNDKENFFKYTKQLNLLYKNYNFHQEGRY